MSQAKPSRSWSTRGGPALLCFLLGVVYLWYISIGTWTHLSQTSTYYYRILAEAFLSGSPALKEAPDPRLLDLSNPYSVQARADIPYMLDAALYKGKYYLYYGPIPALFLAGFMSVFGSGFSDGYVVFASALGALLFSALLLIRIWRNWFDHLPISLLYLSIALIGLTHPIPWMLNTARIYDAAVLAGAALLLAGLYFALDALAGYPAKPMELALASLLWGLAIGTRLSLAGSIALFFGIIVLRLLTRKRTASTKKTLINLSAFVLPIAVCLFALGWYNYIRFGSPLELGYRYTLIIYQGVDLSKTLSVFNPHFFLANLYNYLLNPISVSPTFPFVQTIHGNRSLYAWLARTNSGYVHQDVAGMLLATPFVLFFGFICYQAAHRIIHSPIPRIRTYFSLLSSDEPNAEFVAMTLGIGSVTNLVPLLFFYVNSMRYVVDFLPLLAIAAIIGAWALYARYQGIAWAGSLIRTAFTLTAGYSIILSLLLAISGDANRFQTMNPDLFEKLSHLFGG